MKKSLLLFILSFILSFSVWAQMPSWKAVQQQLASKLDLSAKQKTQWMTLVDQYAPQIEALAGMSGGKDAAKLKSLLSKYNQARNALLTAKQLSKLTSLQNQMGVGSNAADQVIPTMTDE